MMTTTGERVSRLEAENVEIKTHFATKADLSDLKADIYRMMITVALAQTTVTVVAVGVILQFG